MEIKQLYPFALLVVIVSMVIGAGVLALDKFGVSVKEEATVVNESITIAGGTGTTSYDDLLSVTFFGNNSDSTGGTYVLDSDVNWTAAGVITTHANFSGTEHNISYTFDADTPSTTAIFAGRTEVGNIASNWLGLIVTIAILSIIIVLIVTGFGKQTR